MSIEKILGRVKSFLNLILGLIYEYLDSLTLLEEGGLIHLFMFNILLISMLDIIYIVLGNDNVKIFDIKKIFIRLEFIFDICNLFIWYDFKIFLFFYSSKTFF